MPPPPTPHGLLAALLAGGRRADRLTHVRDLPERPGIHTDWPDWADASLVAGYRALGVERPWEHQVDAANAAWSGRHIALATSTGSGKSLAFWLPALTAVRADVAAGLLDPGRIEQTARRGSVLYLSPTKALAADQLAGVERLLDASRARDLRVTTCDGDTSPDERRWIRDHADVVLTNPDFLHFALLPGHRHWSRFLRDLRFVVVDEGHAYRGVFGAHVALVLRRLRRLAAHHRAAGIGKDALQSTGPTFVVASATSADPAVSAGRLVGVNAEQVLVIDRDTSPAGRKTVALWEPPIGPRGGARTEAAADLLADPSEHVPLVRLSAADLAVQPDPCAIEGPSMSGDPQASTPGPPSATPGTALPSAVNAGLHATADDPTVPTDEPAHPRRSATAEVADLLADLVAAGARTLAFTRSRRGAESVAAMARDRLRPISSTLVAQVAAYRGGYLPEERRALEEKLRTGAVRGLATTNALELGVNVAGLDAVLIAGWPGTRMSLWQQAGRAGRAGAEGLVAFVAREDPLDTYLVHHPEAVFEAPLEATVFDPSNPYVLAPHLAAAAAEVPLRREDLPAFGDPSAVTEVLDVLVARGALRRRPTGWYWTHAQSAAGLTDLRGSGGSPIRVVEAGTGRVLGTVDAGSADGSVHDGAVYVHQGVTYIVDRLDLADAVALVRRRDVDYGTWSRSDTSIEIGYGSDTAGRHRQRSWGPVTWGYGPVEVSSQVVSYQRRRLPDMQILASEPLALPERVLPTMAVWWSVPTEVVEAAEVGPDALAGALHAAEHASIGLLPLLATCDRWDLGGVSTEFHTDTGQATVFVHDAYPGGAGFAEHGFALGATWLAATRDAILRCPCASGCPACIQSPKCGSFNSPLDKAGAARLLAAVLDCEARTRVDT